jgi:hypothetical protein
VTDVVAVYGSDGSQLFAAARPIKATVKPNAKFMKHPAETGVTFSDHIVFDPVEIELSMILTPATFADTYQQIKTAWLAVQPLTVVTKADTYPNMFIVAPPHDEDPEIFDTINVAVKLESVIIVNSQYAQLTAVSTPRNTSTVHTGQQAPAAATLAQTTQTSTLYSLIYGGG